MPHRPQWGYLALQAAQTWVFTPPWLYSTYRPEIDCPHRSHRGVGAAGIPAIEPASTHSATIPSIANRSNPHPREGRTHAGPETVATGAV